MNAVLSLLWIIATTKSTDCGPSTVKCPGQEGPDAVLITASETKVYKDGYVHSMLQHKPGEMPIINKTNPISDEFDLVKDSAIRAVIEDEKRRYYIEDIGSRVVRVCTNILFSCKSIEIKSPAGSFKLKNLSTAAAVSQGYFLAFTDVKGDEYQGIIDNGSVFLYTQRVDKMADGRKRNPTGLNVIAKAGDDYLCLVFFDQIYTIHLHNLDKLTAPVVIKKTLDYRLSSTWLGCDPELCFDARVDFAYRGQGPIGMGRGRSRWLVEPTKLMEPHYLAQETWKADSVLQQADLFIVFEGDMASVTESKLERKFATKQLFKETNSSIEAAFSLNTTTSRFYLISDQLVYIYEPASAYTSSNPYFSAKLAPYH
ncbi:hypothetical protein HDE_00251 [Halotydeus destructor]|nr:hypothetical protein HDE_00251 [Halotydeus destructor]